MTIFKRKSDSKLYIIYKNVDGSLTAFPQGKVLEQSDILNKCKLEDFVVFRIENNVIKGFI